MSSIDQANQFASLIDPQFGSSRIVVTYGILTAVYGTLGTDTHGQAYGPGTALQYDVTVQIDDTPIQLSQAIPSQPRPTYLVYAATINTPVIVWLVAGQIFFRVDEILYTEQCS